MYDDALLTEYALHILDGGWLGAFNYLTFAKSASFSFILAFLYLTGIPYSLGLIMAYVFGCYLLSKSAFLFMTKPTSAWMTLYAFLIYSPVMFSEDNFQHVYRDGFVVCFSMYVIAGVIGAFFNVCNQKYKRVIPWSILTSLSLPIFLLMKEDTIWIIPFVFAAMIVTCVAIIYTYRNNQEGSPLKEVFLRIVCVIFPLIISVGAIQLCKAVNYHMYGEYAITDRSDTYFKTMISDIMHIYDEDTDVVWITRDMLQAAADNSPTFSRYWPQISEAYDQAISYWGHEDKGVKGDLAIWLLRSSFNEAGLYEKNGADINKTYKAIHQELQGAFDDGSLLYDEDSIYISSICVGMTQEEILKYYGCNLRPALSDIYRYKNCETSYDYSWGTDSQIARMALLTHSDYWCPDNDSMIIATWQRHIVDIDNAIIRVYGYVSKPVLILSILGFLFMIVLSLRNICHREYTYPSIMLVLIGMILTSIIMILAVVWYCNWLDLRQIVNYVSPVIPLMQTIEFFSIILPICYLKEQFENNDKTVDVEE